MKLEYLLNIFRITAMLVVICNLNACASLIKPNIKTDLKELREGQYTIDKRHATILFKVNHMGFSKFIGRFNDFAATLDFNADKMEISRLEATVEMASIDVNNENFEETLRGDEWFNTEEYPQAFFKTVSVTNIDKNSADFIGELTFLGITAPVTVKVKFNGGGVNKLTFKYTIGFSASSTFKRSDFGLDNYVPTIGDDIELEIHAEFQKN